MQHLMAITIQHVGHAHLLFVTMDTWGRYTQCVKKQVIGLLVENAKVLFSICKFVIFGYQNAHRNDLLRTVFN